MSISSFSLSHPDTLYWETPKQQLHSIITSTCIYNDKEAETQHPHIEKHVQESNKTMFEKPLTPSDVGKLNRLVIPKQHAEKNFPLSGDSIDKGLLLSFEDELGKSWKFRYSYWNSSQSYVLTKGWSRYVKEKRLDAGDVVFFARHRIDSDRLFIGWRRRGEAVDNAAATPQDCRVVNAYHGGGGGDINGGWSRMMVRSGQRYPNPSHYHGHGPHVPCQFDSIHAGSVVQHNQAMEATKGN